MSEINKVVIIVSNISIGGAQRIALTLSKWLRSKDIESTIVAISKSRSNYQIPKQEKIICLGHSRALDLVRTVRLLSSTIAQEAPSLVITMGVSTSIFSVLAIRTLNNVTHIISERNDPRHFLGKPIVRYISRFLMKYADGYVFQTEDARNYYPKNIKNRGKVIPNPIFADNLPGATYLYDNKTIVTMGRLTAQKNHKLLISAFAKFSKLCEGYKLVIYGSGELKEETEQYVDVLGMSESVILYDACNDVQDRIKDAAFFVLSSDFEGMPNALIEAMAMGLPCISTDCPCGGPRYLIENKINGLLVPVGDEMAIVNAMDYLANNYEFRVQIGKKATQIKRVLDADKICEEWLAFCEEVHIKKVVKW